MFARKNLGHCGPALLALLDLELVAVLADVGVVGQVVQVPEGAEEALRTNEAG